MQRRLFALVLEAEPGTTEAPPLRSVDTDYIRELVGKTWIPNDWLRFQGMIITGRPALMRIPASDAKPGEPDPEVHWFYALPDAEAQPEMTYSRLDELYGDRAEVRKRLESGRP